MVKIKIDKISNISSTKSTSFFINLNNELICDNQKKQIFNVNIGTIIDETENKLSNIKNNLFSEIISVINNYDMEGDIFSKGAKGIKKLSFEARRYSGKGLSISFWIKNISYVIIFLITFFLWQNYPDFFQNIFTFISKSFTTIVLVFGTFILANMKLITNFFSSKSNSKFIDFKYYAKSLIKTKVKMSREKPIFIVFNNIHFIEDDKNILRVLKLLIDSFDFSDLVIIINLNRKGPQINDFIKKYFKVL